MAHPEMPMFWVMVWFWAGVSTYIRGSEAGWVTVIRVVALLLNPPATVLNA